MDKETQSSVNCIQDLLRAEFDAGIRISSDPANANLPDLAIRVTTLYSSWFGRTCKVCFDSFREGDLVRLCPLCGTAFHDDGQYDLHCWQRYFANRKACGSGKDQNCPYAIEGETFTDNGFQATETIVSQTKVFIPLTHLFLGGIESIWRPYGALTGIKLERGSEWVGRKCPWCRNRMRVGDWVIQCPCGANCGTVFHQDIFRHLTCWNEWNGVSGNQYCPTTGTPFEMKSTDVRE